ncbi:metallophosphoesterase [Paenibacillus frigoriresistens]|uniref:stalk domain-containing protein n=1 Tax=Paenibacillus alginolyticus TaxID=59839 RepID=UPI001563B8CF|nr:stalk domain-containing protein [Paenibacillus frigoriresistens]NRF95246.1 metallophosphoesterase [Paenibacillus frigoriresistens]
MKKMLKTWIGASLTSVMLLGGGATVVTAADMGDSALRTTVESMNGTLGWASDAQQITVDIAGSKATLKLGSVDATLKGQVVKLDKAPYLANGVTQVSAATVTQLKDAFKSTDKLLFTYSSVGDCRIDSTVTDASAQDLKWLVNSKVLTRMMDEMQAQKSSMLFYNGDMIMGYTPNSDVNILNREYAFWRGIVATAFEHGMYVFPVPGNHETQDNYVDSNGKTVKVSTKANEDTWRDNMGDIIVDQKRFAQILGENIAGWDPNNYPQIGMDHITTQQQQLDYSFDYRGSHFVVINTDPTGNDSHAPTEWLDKDLKAAKDRGMKHSFIFGHKLAYTYYFDSSAKISGLDVDKDAASAFWKVVQDNKATYLSGHEHIFNVSRPNNGSAYQVVVGSGGSPFEAKKATSNPIDRDYAYVTVKVYESGKVHFDAYGFDAFYGPTQNFMSWDLDQGF